MGREQHRLPGDEIVVQPARGSPPDDSRQQASHRRQDRARLAKVAHRRRDGERQHEENRRDQCRHEAGEQPDPQPRTPQGAALGPGAPAKDAPERQDRPGGGHQDDGKRLRGLKKGPAQRGQPAHHAGTGAGKCPRGDLHQQRRDGRFREGLQKADGERREPDERKNPPEQERIARKSVKRAVIRQVSGGDALSPIGVEFHVLRGREEIRGVAKRAQHDQAHGKGEPEGPRKIRQGTL